MKSHDVKFVRSGRGKAQCAPDPAYPKGKAVRMPGIEALPHCVVEVPYPAPECGWFLVTCSDCPVRLVITAAGRPDDPVSVTVPCEIPEPQGAA